MQSPTVTSQPQPEPALQSKPIYTSPAKLGSYGYNLKTLSEIKGANGVVSIPSVSAIPIPPGVAESHLATARTHQLYEGFKPEVDFLRPERPPKSRR